MSVKHTIFVVTLIAVMLVSLTMGADKPADSSASTAADKVDKNSLSTTSTAPATHDYGIPHNLMQMLTSGGTVVLGVVVVAVIAALVMPVFGIRICQVLGNCENNYLGGNTASGYSASNMYQNDVYGQYPQASYPSSNTYQKRSVDYMGPVLHMLKTAYDRYGQNSMPSSKNTL